MAFEVSSVPLSLTIMREAASHLHAPIELTERAGIAVDGVHRSVRSEQHGQGSCEHARASAEISPNAAGFRHGGADERDGVAVLHRCGLGSDQSNAPG